MKEIERIGLLKMDFLGPEHADAHPRRARRDQADRRASMLDIDAIPLDDREDLPALPGRPDLRHLPVRELAACARSCARPSPAARRPDRAERALPARARSRAAWSTTSSRASRARPRSSTSCRSSSRSSRDTYGVIAYQEQVMRIADVLAGFTLGAADMLRKAMGKKDPEVMAKQRGSVHGRARRRNGINEKKAAQDLRPDGALRRLRLQQVALDGLRAAWPIRRRTSRRTTRGTSSPRC